MATTVYFSMLTLCWSFEGRDCTACFNSEAEARQCAELLGARSGVQDIQWLDEDGVTLEPGLTC